MKELQMPPEGPVAQEGLEVEFAVRADVNGRPCACSIVPLPRGSVQFVEVSPVPRTGVVERIVAGPQRAASLPTLPVGGLSGLIVLEPSSQPDELPPGATLPFYSKDFAPGLQQLFQGDRVMFHVATNRANGQRHAAKIQVIQRTPQMDLALPQAALQAQAMLSQLHLQQLQQLQLTAALNLAAHQGAVSSLQPNLFGAQRSLGQLFPQAGNPVGSGPNTPQSLSRHSSQNRMNPQALRAEASTPPPGLSTAANLQQALQQQQQQGLPSPLQAAAAALQALQQSPLPSPSASQRELNVPPQLTTPTSSEPGREVGTVLTIRDKYGFIKSAAGKKHFFHSEQVRGIPDLSPGMELSFVSKPDPRGGENALAMQIQGPLPPGTVDAARSVLRQGPPLRGRVLGLPLGPAQGEEGVIIYSLEEGGTDGIASCLFTPQAVEGGSRVVVGGEVEFTIAGGAEASTARSNGQDKASAASSQPRKAAVVRTVTQASSGSAPAPPVPQREVGQVAVVKQNFGFLQSVDRLGDVFFHQSQLAGGPLMFETLKPGSEVEYWAVPDPIGPASRKLIAVGVVQAAPGSSAFHETDPKPRLGVVTERAGSTGSGGGRHNVSGLLEFVQDDGKRGALPYPQGEEVKADAPLTPESSAHAAPAQGGGRKQAAAPSGDALRPGDYASFLIRRNLRDEARAKKLAEERRDKGSSLSPYLGKSCAQVAPRWFVGEVVESNRSTGKVELRSADADEVLALRKMRSESSQTPLGLEVPEGPSAVTRVRVPFHQSDVDAALTLFEGDRVAVILREELVFTGVLGWPVKARRLVRVAQGEASLNAAKTGASLGPGSLGMGGAPGGLRSALRNDDRGAGAIRVAKGPDGTPGFALGRGRPPAMPQFEKTRIRVAAPGASALAVSPSPGKSLGRSVGKSAPKEGAKFGTSPVPGPAPPKQKGKSPSPAPSKGGKKDREDDRDKDKNRDRDGASHSTPTPKRENSGARKGDRREKSNPPLHPGPPLGTSPALGGGPGSLSSLASKGEELPGKARQLSPQAAEFTPGGASARKEKADRRDKEKSKSPAPKEEPK